MVSFTNIIATVGLLSATVLASPAAAPQVADIKEFEYSSVEVVGLAARQDAKACLASIGLGAPSNKPFCGLIGVKPRAATTFVAATAQFPKCTITIEVNYPNCHDYRVTNVQDCGGERKIDIREANETQGC